MESPPRKRSRPEFSQHWDRNRERSVEKDCSGWDRSYSRLDDRHRDRDDRNRTSSDERHRERHGSSQSSSAGAGSHGKQSTASKSRHAGAGSSGNQSTADMSRAGLVPLGIGRLPASLVVLGPSLPGLSWQPTVLLGPVHQRTGRPQTRLGQGLRLLLAVSLRRVEWLPSASVQVPSPVRIGKVWMLVLLGLWISQPRTGLPVRMSLIPVGNHPVGLCLYTTRWPWTLIPTVADQGFCLGPLPVIWGPRTMATRQGFVTDPATGHHTLTLVPDQSRGPHQTSVTCVDGSVLPRLWRNRDRWPIPLKNMGTLVTFWGSLMLYCHLWISNLWGHGPLQPK